MTDARDENGNLLSDEIRLTKFGKALRASSLDELPEIFNILKGDMSLIDSRPLLVQYLPRYNEEQHHRHDVRPGLTGYAQAHGRNAVSWEEKFAMDVWYVNHVSMKTDIKVVLDTVKTVVKKRRRFIRHIGNDGRIYGKQIVIGENYRNERFIYYWSGWFWTRSCMVR